jgi:RND superfamily putative drug exporter
VVSRDAVDRLRHDYVPQAFEGVPGRALVGGFTAENLDGFDMLNRYTPIVFAFVLGLSFILLLIVFRSIVVPIKAVIMNLLSVGAAYGLLVLVTQEGVGAELFGFQQVESIEAWLTHLSSSPSSSASRWIPCSCSAASESATTRATTTQKLWPLASVRPGV